MEDDDINVQDDQNTSAVPTTSELATTSVAATVDVESKTEDPLSICHDSDRFFNTTVVATVDTESKTEGPVPIKHKTTKEPKPVTKQSEVSEEQQHLSKNNAAFPTTSWLDPVPTTSELATVTVAATVDTESKTEEPNPVDKQSEVSEEQQHLSKNNAAFPATSWLDPVPTTSELAITPVAVIVDTESKTEDPLSICHDSDRFINTPTKQSEVSEEQRHLSKNNTTFPSTSWLDPVPATSELATTPVVATVDTESKTQDPFPIKHKTTEEPNAVAEHLAGVKRHRGSADQQTVSRTSSDKKRNRMESKAPFEPPLITRHQISRSPFLVKLGLESKQSEVSCE